MATVQALRTVSSYVVNPNRLPSSCRGAAAAQSRYPSTKPPLAYNLDSISTDTSRRRYSQSSTRLSFSRRNNNNEGFLEKAQSSIKNFARSVLPSSWFQSDRERKAELERKRMEDEISSGMSTFLKDAPLPVRMIGGLIRPILSSVMSTISETLEEQQTQVNQIMTASRCCIENDERIGRALGTPLQFSPPFSQATSSSVINNQSSSRVDLAFQVNGSFDNGICKVTSVNGDIITLQVQLSNGQVINVDPSRSTSPPKRFNNDNEDGNFIEAEIIEKKPRR